MLLTFKFSDPQVDGLAKEFESTYYPQGMEKVSTSLNGLAG